jgi:hypothetical protein
MSETPQSVRSRDPLIETAVRPLSDNAELHLAAAGFLENLKISDLGVETAIARWSVLDAGQRRPLWGIALWAVLIVVSVAVWISASGELFRYYEWGKWAMSSFGTMPPDPVDTVGRHLTAGQKLILFGDLTKDGRVEQKEGLWLSEPENPAYFAEYATAYVAENAELPPDFLETARRLDPDNAWFTYFAASVEARESVKSNLQRAKGKRGLAKSWEVLDQARMDRSLALFHEAGSQGASNDYAAEMLLMRLALLAQGTLIEKNDSIGCLANCTVFGSIQLKRAIDVVEAKASTLAEAGDAAGFRELSKDVEAYLRRESGTKVTTMLNEMVFAFSVKALAESFGPAAEKLGFESEAARWKGIGDRLRTRDLARGSSSFMVEGKEVDPRRVTGLLCGSSLEVGVKVVENPPPLKDADFEPGRMLDHEILSRFSGYAVWLVMGTLTGAVALYRFRVSGMVRRLADRVEDLLRPVDWIWILGGGVLLPFGFVMIVNRLTPLGGRDFGMLGTSLLLPTGHFLGLLVLWLLTPLVVIRWRLARRAGFFGFSESSWAEGFALLCAAAFVPVIGWVAISGSLGGFWLEWMKQLGLDVEADSSSVPLFWCAIGLLVVPLLWLLITSCIAVFSGADRLLRRTTLSVILVRLYAFAMLVMILATTGFKAGEQFWFERETLTKFDAALPGWTRYEYLVAVQMRKEIRGILGFER